MKRETPRYLRVARWDEVFENSESRKLRTLSRLQTPIDFGSAGYGEIMRLEDGEAIYGVWWAILAIAARCTPRGTLRRSDGRPHDARSIASSSHMHVHTVERALSVLVLPEIGWLLTDSKRRMKSPEASRNSGKSREVPGPRARAAEGTGQDRTGGEETPPMPPSPGGESESGLVPTADIESKPKPGKPKAKRAAKRVGAPWPDGWTFGDAEWAIANRCGAPSRESAARAFEAFETWARENQVESPAWGLRWSSWCQRARDKFGWPPSGSAGAKRDAEVERTRELIDRQRAQREANLRARKAAEPAKVTE